MQQCYVFTTLRFDESLRHHAKNTSASDQISSSVYLLQYHYDRLLEAANAVFGSAGQHTLEKAGVANALELQQHVEKAIEEQTRASSAQLASFRVRVQINGYASVATTIAEVPRIAHERLFVSDLIQPVDQAIPWTVSLDLRPTKTSIATQCKIHDRSDYNRARSEAGIESLTAEKEVLLYDEAGYIFDASITTPYFFRDGRWTTPSNSYGGQRGTTRRWALTQGLCVESGVHVDSVQEREMIWLSNAARGFFRAQVSRTSRIY
ncbi:hypothetical protein AMS68_000139 [Peltaster fructicola]|uniref:Aminodeoxychorismate lyase n=1 Tax=Peltaster fructicola TaxID=286661 RepID=A0A6H0XIS6_9PEZI|nr:hypothetical protein AMS68_000139 [Peltaster fructicola]